MPPDTTNQDTTSSAPGLPPQYPQYPPYPYAPPSDDEIDLRELWNVIWRGKWIVMAVTALFAIGAVFYALSLPNIYRAQTVLAPAPEAQSGGGRMGGQLGGLASLAGVNLSAGGGVDKVAVAMEVLRSRQFITRFIHRHEILPDLMAAESWSWITQQLIYDHNIFNPDKQEWVREASPPRRSKPSDAEAYRAFMVNYSVTQDRDTRFVKITLDHLSPYVAKQWVDWLVQDLNEYMKQVDVAEAQRSIEYLTEQLNATSLADMRRVFYQLIEEQTKTIMLAASRDEYIFSTIDPPVVAEDRVRPNRALIAALGVVVGGMLSIVFLFLCHFIGGRSSFARQSESLDK